MKNIFTLFTILLAFQINAQTFTNYTVDDGLVNNSTNCITVDAANNIWIGTQEGFSKFDGTTWTNYDQTSHPGLVNNNIKAIALDSDNNIWLGTDFGLSKYDGTTWTTYTDDDGLADNRIRYIVQGPNGAMWFANNDGLSIFDGTTWTSYTMDDGLPFGGTNYIYFDSEGTAWLGTPLGGALIFDGTDFSGITEDDGLLSNKVTCIAIDEDGNRWFGNSDGISVFDENNAFVTNHEIIFELPPPDELNPVEDLKIGQNGRIWVGVYVDYLVTVGGISLYANETWSDYDVEDGLVGPVVRQLAIDGNNDVWVATSTGISKISEFPSNTFDLETARAIQVYPNPVLNNLKVEVPEDLLEKSYQVFNSIGILVAEGKINAMQMTLDLSDFSSGVYYLNMDKVYAEKVIVQK